MPRGADEQDQEELPPARSARDDVLQQQVPGYERADGLPEWYGISYVRLSAVEGECPISRSLTKQRHDLRDASRCPGCEDFL